MMTIPAALKVFEVGEKTGGYFLAAFCSRLPPFSVASRLSCARLEMRPAAADGDVR